ncbi:MULTISPECIES: MBL fold metallo-hydrolase [unclassified Modestobacter]|uniref:MBL fold metallo-hydrolase n=1 Tax=unclassified Modestobacter TaxID=2643866 RepID=UPI0022AAAFFF|nr:MULTISPECIES: MBL fold metallo-hydrolase [unclassified Modestobacter]MCZ2824371.1 MBL fold metallo-hydrolase [Modestobacter sp. VKM Ac-2981]MCZ2854101.1 MBL fold metallo-hydrolase [Modestobacter sp. VKM Ac-2982]
MRLTVVGCSGSGPGPSSPASCYLVEHEEFALLLDLGNGSFGALQGLTDPSRVDAVYLSHLHADHCLDAAPFIVWHRYSGRSDGRAVPLYAPVGADRRLAAAYDADGGPIDDVFDVTPVGSGTWSIGPFEVRTARTAHPVECYAVRLTAGGRSLVYTGDTGPSDAVVELARGADVLLAEAAHPDVPDLPPALHLTGRQAGEHAAAAGVGRLLVTHVPAWVDTEAQLAAARSVFPAAELARHAAVYDI